jgi:hypothetical protein
VEGAGSLTTKYGFGCDNMVCARLITADRAVVKASEDENRDLFWAVRGGGGNFGIVISLELRLHLIDKVLSGHVTYPIAKIKEVLQFLDEYVKDIPDDLYVIATVLPQPGPRVIDIGVVWSGDANEGERIFTSAAHVCDNSARLDSSEALRAGTAKWIGFTVRG